MTYNQTLEWMFAQLPMYQSIGRKAFSAKLDTIQLFCSYLQHPEKKFKSIHVGGTNGKGSSCHMLASILQEAGYSVGLYTSPHLKDFRERIKISGEPVSQTFVVNFICKHKAYLEEHHLSFFEMSVGMAFDCFASKEVDIAIVEVGLGGRLDSTNVIIPQVSLITNIGWDHTDLLGKSLQEIAVEKAGIMKPEVPVVVSERQPEIDNIFQKRATELNTSIIFAGDLKIKEYPNPLLGNYQKKNIKGVLAVIELLSDFTVNEEHIRQGLNKVVQNTGLLGRWQVLQNNPKVICDTAHNLDGLRIVLRQILSEEFKSLHIILGFVKEKDLDSILPLFPKLAIYYFSKPGVPRGLNAEILSKKANEFGLKGTVYPNIPLALKTALKTASSDDLIFIGGSTFTVAEVV